MKGVSSVNDILRYEIAKFIFPFIGNGSYNNNRYYRTLVKKYGKKTVIKAIKQECENGSIIDALQCKP